MFVRKHTRTRTLYCGPPPVTRCNKENYDDYFDSRGRALSPHWCIVAKRLIPSRRAESSKESLYQQVKLITLPEASVLWNQQSCRWINWKMMIKWNQQSCRWRWLWIPVPTSIARDFCSNSGHIAPPPVNPVPVIGFCNLYKSKSK